MHSYKRQIYVCNFQGTILSLMVSKTNIFHGDFPGSSAGKESACNAGDPSSIPGSGRSSEEWIGYPFQNSSAFLVAQIVKNHCSERDLGSISGLERRYKISTNQLESREDGERERSYLNFYIRKKYGKTAFKICRQPMRGIS